MRRADAVALLALLATDPGMAAPGPPRVDIVRRGPERLASAEQEPWAAEKRQLFERSNADRRQSYGYPPVLRVLEHERAGKGAGPRGFSVDARGAAASRWAPPPRPGSRPTEASEHEP